MLYVFSFPTRIVFGSGAVQQLGAEAQRLGIARPLLVADPGVVACGLAEKVLAVARAAGLKASLFDDVNPNPIEKNVEDGLAAYLHSQCDSVIGLGGGSPLDTAKAVRLVATHPFPLEPYDDKFDGGTKITANIPPMIAIATTAGTGSEVGRSTVIILKSNQRKTVIFSPYLMPNVALADPELTLGMPPKITAGTGLDALTHNVEAYLSLGYHPLCDAIALQGAALAYRFLPRAVHTGSNLEARTQMLMAAMMGAVAFQKGLGAVHSLAHPLSSVANLHHGTTNGILLPHVLVFNRTVVEKRMHDLASAMGVADCEASDTEAADALIAKVRDLLTEVGIPTHLGGLGVTREMIPQLAPKAMEDACHQCNPRPCTEPDMTALYEAAL